MVQKELLDLLRMKLGKDISHEDFRIALEDIYTFKLNRNLLSLEEFNALTRLFEVAIWYSPFPEDRTEVPQYRDEKDLEQALKKTQSDLGLDRG